MRSSRAIGFLAVAVVLATISFFAPSAWAVLFSAPDDVPASAEISPSNFRDIKSGQIGNSTYVLRSFVDTNGPGSAGACLRLSISGAANAGGDTCGTVAQVAGGFITVALLDVPAVGKSMLYGLTLPTVTTVKLLDLITGDALLTMETTQTPDIGGNKANAFLSVMPQLPTVGAAGGGLVQGYGADGKPVGEPITLTLI